MRINTLILVFVGAFMAGVLVLVISANIRHEVKPVTSKTVDTTITYRRTLHGQELADSIVTFAKQFIGTPYHTAGKCVATGFDCSGFTSFVYKHYGIDIDPGSNTQINAGRRIPLTEASKGDLLVFTGTNLHIREPGHVGIVISNKGEPVTFIHSSSNGGVKISRIEDTRYAERLLQVRRVID